MDNVKISTISLAGGYQEPVNANTTGVKSFGFFPQNTTSDDATVSLTRDGNGSLVLTDPAAGTMALRLRSSSAVAGMTAMAGTFLSLRVATT